MSVFVDISAALESHLNSMAGKPPIAWENYSYDPSMGTLYIRPTLLAGDVVQATLGTTGTDQNLGVYQIDIFSEAGQGKGEALSMADTIANHFKRGTDLTYNSRTVRIRNVSRQVGFNNPDGWYQIIVEVSYIAFTEARS